MPERPGRSGRSKLVLRCHRLGLSPAEIGEIIAVHAAAPSEHGELEHLLARITERRAELESKLMDITETLSELDTVEVGCREELRAMGDRLVARGRVTKPGCTLTVCRAGACGVVGTSRYMSPR